MAQSLAFPMTESSQVGDARRMATALAARSGFDETAVGNVAIVVTELATNLIRHAVGGEILLRPLEDEAGALEILALDRGPGIPNLQQCLQDGYSTGGSPGTGFGAVQRLSNYMDVYTQPQSGTVLVSYIGPTAADKTFTRTGAEIGVVSVPFAGEIDCGDTWAVRSEGSSWEVLVADGLGHGSPAAEASRAMAEVFERYPGRDLKYILERGNAALRSTRGAAVSIASVDVSSGQVRYAGVGNVSGTILSGGESRSMVSYNGTVGHQVRKIQEFVYPWSPADLLILYSDGLATQWRLDAYPGLAARHPSLIAGVLYRDFKRQRDDVTVIVSRQAQQDNLE